MQFKLPDAGQQMQPDLHPAIPIHSDGIEQMAKKCAAAVAAVGDCADRFRQIRRNFAFIGLPGQAALQITALLDRLEDLTGARVPRGELATESAAWEASIDAAAADDEEMTEYIHQLERTRDTWDSPEASGDAIAQEFERYLRRSDGKPGDGPSKPGRDDPRR